MKINRHNLTIVSHCAPNNLQGRITNGLEFSPSGTSATNGHYSVSVSALEVDKNEPLGCITADHVQGMLKHFKGDEARIFPASSLPFIEGKRPCIDLIPRKPAKFEIYLNADYLLQLAQSVRDFAPPGEDPIVRIQFSGADEAARLEAHNTVTGQTWEALIMPRRPDTEAKRFAEPMSTFDKALRVAVSADIEAERRASAVPPPPPPVVEETEFEAALRLAASL